MENQEQADLVEAARRSAVDFRLVLASRSPRRRSLLSDAGFVFATLPSEDGTEESNEDAALAPRDLVRKLAESKAQNVARQISRRTADAQAAMAAFDRYPRLKSAPIWALGCDSVAEVAGEILGKPRDRDDAERMLRTLSGSRHAVHTGVAIWSPTNLDAPILSQTETSILEMEPLSDARLADYLASGQWEGKAGAFGYQDGVDWLRLVSGSESNVVGLPLEAFSRWALALLNGGAIQ